MRADFDWGKEGEDERAVIPAEPGLARRGKEKEEVVDFDRCPYVLEVVVEKGMSLKFPVYSRRGQ